MKRLLVLFLLLLSSGTDCWASEILNWHVQKLILHPDQQPAAKQ